MSFAAVFRTVAAQYGQMAEVQRDGELLGSGLVILRPLLDKTRQFVPTDLGVDRVETVLCLGEASLPFAPQPGETVLVVEEERWDVYNVRPVTGGQELIYWRAILTRRDGEEA